MAVHDNGTMDVRVGDNIERRRYSINVNAPFSNRYLDRMQNKYEPELRDGEEAFFSIGDDIPTIVVTHAPCQTESHDLQFTGDEFGHGR